MKKENAAPAAGAQPELELRVRFLNINEGQNQELMERCRSLREYSEFVSRIRKYAAEGTGIEEAVDRTVTECIAEGKAESVLLALEMKGSVSGQLRAHILAETDVPVLEEWLKDGMASSADEMAAVAESIMKYGVGFLRQNE